VRNSKNAGRIATGLEPVVNVNPVWAATSRRMPLDRSPYQKLMMLLKKSSAPDLFRPGGETTRLEALYTVGDDHLGI
jgi:hypothetical protein